MKITRTTLKKFLRDNEGKIWVKKGSDFDGMVDCVMPVKDEFTPAQKTDKSIDYTLGILGVWLVGQSRDSFTAYEDDQFAGIRYYNCCGDGIIAIKK